MTYKVRFSLDAASEWRSLNRRDRQVVIHQIEMRLTYAPGEETRNLKHLRSNNLAEWELRVNQFRVFYDIDEQASIVEVVAIGYKRGNRLFVAGKEYEL